MFVRLAGTYPHLLSHHASPKCYSVKYFIFSPSTGNETWDLNHGMQTLWLGHGPTLGFLNFKCFSSTELNTSLPFPNPSLPFPGNVEPHTVSARVASLCSRSPGRASHTSFHMASSVEGGARERRGVPPCSCLKYPLLKWLRNKVKAKSKV